MPFTARFAFSSTIRLPCPLFSNVMVVPKLSRSIAIFISSSAPFIKVFTEPTLASISPARIIKPTLFSSVILPLLMIVPFIARPFAPLFVIFRLPLLLLSTAVSAIIMPESVPELFAVIEESALFVNVPVTLTRPLPVIEYEEPVLILFTETLLPCKDTLPLLLRIPAEFRSETDESVISAADTLLFKLRSASAPLVLIFTEPVVLSV